ncbi:MAG: response regulator transcription factor [Bacteroidales bacterium]|nr:response regulator transcription factor [Bacteroidales bacterium]
MKKKILIVDDELSIRMLLENYIGKTYDIVTKTDGLEGIKYLEEGNLPDLIVADIQMPNLDGYEMLKQVRASGFFGNLPMIMLSGIESSQERVKCLRMGADDYLVKPFNPEELLLRINNLISRTSK